MRAGRHSRGHTLGELMVVMAITTVVIATIAGVVEPLVRHQKLATDYAEDLAQGTRVADRIAREVRSALARLPSSVAPYPASEDVLLLATGTDRSVRISVSSDGRVVLERFGGRARLLGSEDLGRVGGLSFARAPSPGSRLVSFDVELPHRAPGAKPAYLSSCALVGGEAGP